MKFVVLQLGGFFSHEAIDGTEFHPGKRKELQPDTVAMLSAFFGVNVGVVEIVRDLYIKTLHEKIVSLRVGDQTLLSRRPSFGLDQVGLAKDHHGTEAQGTQAAIECGVPS